MPTATHILYTKLLQELKNSTGTDRIAWARQIVDDEADIKELSKLLFADDKTALRYAWLLSDIGAYNKETLFDVLPYLFNQRAKTKAPKFEQQFVKYWRICGIPEENKGLAIDYMFKWLITPEIDTHTKTITLTVLYRLCVEYPELKNELKLCLEDQPDDIDVSFKKGISQLLAKL